MMFSMEITIYCYHDPVDRTQAKWNHRNGVEVGFALLLSETIVFPLRKVETQVKMTLNFGPQK